MTERNQIYKKKINLKFEKVRDDVLENSIYDLQNDFNNKTTIPPSNDHE